MKKIILFLTPFIFFSSLLYADQSKHNVVLDANQVKIQVRGIVCSFCAFGVQKNLSKLEFLNPKEFKKGVLVDVKNQQITLALAEDKQLNLVEIYNSIKKGGYEPEVVYLRVKGHIEKENIIRDQEKQLRFYLKSEMLPESGSVEVELHFDANIIPSLSADKPIEAFLDRIIE